MLASYPTVFAAAGGTLGIVCPAPERTNARDIPPASTETAPAPDPQMQSHRADVFAAGNPSTMARPDPVPPYRGLQPPARHFPASRAVPALRPGTGDIEPAIRTACSIKNAVGSNT